MKKKAGFQCKMCNHCCTTDVLIFDEDYYFLKDNKINLEGFEYEKLKEGVWMNLKDKKGFYGQDGDTCWYLDEVTNECQIHPLNPLICFSYPFSVNLDERTVSYGKCQDWLKESTEEIFLEQEDVDEVLKLVYQLRPKGKRKK